MNDQLQTDVQLIVDSIFKEKEDADMRKAAERALESASSSIGELKELLVVSEDKVTELETELSSVNEKNSEMEKELGSLKSEKEEAEKNAEAASKKDADQIDVLNEELSSIKKDIAAKERITELDTAGVALENKEEQFSRVKEMTDEEFTSYRDELVALRQSVVAELDKSEDGGIIPANVNTDDANTAALNMELETSSLVDKYSELGNAMADKVSK